MTTPNQNPNAQQQQFAPQQQGFNPAPQDQQQFAPQQQGFNPDQQQQQQQAPAPQDQQQGFNPNAGQAQQAPFNPNAGQAQQFLDPNAAPQQQGQQQAPFNPNDPWSGAPQQGTDAAAVQNPAPPANVTAAPITADISSFGSLLQPVSDGTPREHQKLAQEKYIGSLIVARPIDMKYNYQSKNSTYAPTKRVGIVNYIVVDGPHAGEFADDVWLFQAYLSGDAEEALKSGKQFFMGRLAKKVPLGAKSANPAWLMEKPSPEEIQQAAQFIEQNGWFQRQVELSKLHAPQQPQQ